MTPRLVLIGAVVTLLTVIAAIVAVLDRPGPATVGTDSAPALPRLRDRADEVARIRITDGTASVTLARGADVTLARGAGGDWSVVERDGYPAAADRVRRLVGDLADMRLVEAKTAKPERFARLDVADPAGADAPSRRVLLETATGDRLAEVILGRRVYGYTGGREAGTYIRRAEDDRAWLASGAIAIDAEPARWLAPVIFEVPIAAVRSVRVQPLDGAPYVIASPDDGAADSPDAVFTLSPLPDGRSTDPAALRRLVSAVAAPTLEDVQPIASIALPDRAARIDVEATDGLRLTLRLATVAEAPWLMVGVAAEPDAGADAIATAATLSERLDGWAFRLPPQAASRMLLDMEPLAAPAPSAEGEQ